jgi:hypothetical protein
MLKQVTRNLQLCSLVTFDEFGQVHVPNLKRNGVLEHFNSAFIDSETLLLV